MARITVKEGHTFNIVASFSIPSSATIDWGDKAPPGWRRRGGHVSGSHVYADNGEYQVTVHVTNVDLDWVKTIFNVVVEER